MADWNEQTPSTTSSAGRYSDAQSERCNHHTALRADCSVPPVVSEYYNNDNILLHHHIRLIASIPLEDKLHKPVSKHQTIGYQ